MIALSPGLICLSFVSWKYASKSLFKLAFQFDVRLPTGNHHNVPLQPYSAKAVGYGGMGLFSLYTHPLQPGSGLAWDLNLGYFNHNDVGLKLANSDNDTLAVEAATQEMIFGTAARFMGKRFGLFVEIHSRLFLQQPPETAYTRENSMYLTPGFIFQFNPYIQLVASADLMLQGRDDKTRYDYENIEFEKPWETVPNLPDWRFNFGINIRLKSSR